MYMVGHLFQNYDTIYAYTCGFFPRILATIPGTRYTCVFCHLYLRSFLLCGVFIPKYMTIFLQTRIYMRTKKFIHMGYKQACVYGVEESRHIRGTKLYCQQKNSFMYDEAEK